MLEMLLKRVNALEKKLEKYYEILKVNNELDFVLKGTYITESDMDKIMQGIN